MRSLPYFCRGQVVRGFGRGSKELGIPTANFPESVVDNLPADISTGIYYGWARVDNGDIHKMVMSIGWNPYYKNTKKSMETHVIHKFKEDFYNQTLSVAMVGYIRPERGFKSVDELIAAIHSDIEEAKMKLDLPEHLKLFLHVVFLPVELVLEARAAVLFRCHHVMSRILRAKKRDSFTVV